LHNIEKIKESLTLGEGISLTTAMETFHKYSSETGFKYLRHLAYHIDLIVSVPVRNMQHRRQPDDQARTQRVSIRFILDTGDRWYSDTYPRGTGRQEKHDAGFFEDGYASQDHLQCSIAPYCPMIMNTGPTRSCLEPRTPMLRSTPASSSNSTAAAR